MTSCTPSEFEPLQAIGQDIYLHETSQPEDDANKGPSLVILCTWLGGATPSRVSKYVQGYMEMFPESAILLINARLSEITVLPFSVMHSRLSPARDVIFRHAAISRRKPSILWHIFSNGGCNTAIQLAQSLQHDNKQRAESLDVDKAFGGIILDCCPGNAEFHNIYRAASYSLPSAYPARAVGHAVLYPTIRVITAIQNTGLIASIDDLRTEINDSTLFGSSAHRLYLYSKADLVVPWEDVEAHMAHAGSVLGYSVQSKAFENGGHCALVREHADVYWEKIKAFWDGLAISPPPKDTTRKARSSRL